MTEHEEVDSVLRRTIDELRTLPAVNDPAIERIVSAARVTPQDRTTGTVRGSGYNVAARWRVPAAVAAGLALVAAIGGYAMRGRVDAERSMVASAHQAAPVVAGGSETSGLTPVAAPAGAAAAEAAVPTQFVLDSPNAGSVALVGDFNEWDARSAPLARDPQTGLWTVTMPIAPGRHVYAFLVDGKDWTLDPRAPKEMDSDFGRPGSVLLVEGR